jgi:hypothetical protein
VLEVITMCGHGMVCQKLVQKMAKRVGEGKTSALEAGEKLAGTCTCGIFNPVRAAEILEREAAGDIPELQRHEDTKENR